MPDIRHFDADAVLDEVVEIFWRRGMPATGVQSLVTATGVNRSSLYAAFGSKNDLYVAALRRYIERHSAPAFARLADAGTGLPAVEQFFDGLIRVRCSGAHAGWGCLITNAHADAEYGHPEVRSLLKDHHRLLREAMRAALGTADRLGQLRGTADLDATADLLASLAYGVNLRSRAGAGITELTAVVAAALAPVRDTTDRQQKETTTR